MCYIEDLARGSGCIRTTPPLGITFQGGPDCVLPELGLLEILLA